MTIQIPFNSFKGVNSVDNQSSLGFDLYNKEKPLRPDNIVSDFSLFEQYNIERDACEKFRYIFTINPICSNVLFNMQTEVTQFEGSNSANVITNMSSIDRSEVVRADTFETDNKIQNTSPINRYQAINDTEYSHEANGGFEYHCGVDIFNNHMLRKNGFVHINKYKSSDSLSGPVYNTIRDYVRDGEGNIVESRISPTYNKNVTTKIHLYTLDNSKSLKESYLENINEQNGWIGFTNQTNIEIENNEEDDVRINRMFANRNACEFIDLYPDRTLFSFLPKYNKYRKRSEKNWDYCITYPCEIDYDKFNIICGGENQAMRCYSHSGVNSNSISVVYCRSLMKHNLHQGDLVSVYYYDDTENEEDAPIFRKYNKQIQVVSVGDEDFENTDFVFAVRLNDVLDIFESILEYGLFFKKLVNGIECDYYFRKYKKLKNFDYNGNRTLELTSDIGKCAYAENIYGDRIAQIVFTDDIDITGLVDHRGRKLTETYFTVIKRNKGRQKWYNQNNPQYNTEDIEYSHCFGQVTSGLYFGDLADKHYDYNIKYLHNISLNTAYTDDIQGIDDIPIDHSNVIEGKKGNGPLEFVAYSALGETVLYGIPKKIEQDITIDNDMFYGDVVEFDPYNYIETELTPVLHRFNTVQREWIRNKNYATLMYDKIIYDDFDLNSNGDSRTFTVSATDMSLVSYNDKQYKLYSNVKPEGYYYNPHTLVKVREEEQYTTRVKCKRINFTNANGYYDMISNITHISFIAPINYGFMKHTNIAMYDAGGKINGIVKHTRTIWGEISEITGNNVTIDFSGDIFGVLETGISINDELNYVVKKPRYSFYWSDLGVPTYAVFVPEITSFVWKSVIPPSQLDDGMDLYNLPFANGRFYIEKNITFFNRRQDKDAKFGLLYAKNPIVQSPSEFFNIEGEGFNIQQVFDFYNNVTNICW